MAQGTDAAAAWNPSKLWNLLQLYSESSSGSPLGTRLMAAFTSEFRQRTLCYSHQCHPLLPFCSSMQSHQQDLPFHSIFTHRVCVWDILTAIVSAVPLPDVLFIIFSSGVFVRPMRCNLRGTHTTLPIMQVPTWSRVPEPVQREHLHVTLGLMQVLLCEDRSCGGSA